MEQKIIFLDIDGTIAEPGGSVPVPSALEAMKRAKAKGHKVVLCSGRSRDVLHSMLDFDFDAVVTNGELIHRRLGHLHGQRRWRRKGLGGRGVPSL